MGGTVNRGRQSLIDAIPSVLNPYRPAFTDRQHSVASISPAGLWSFARCSHGVNGIFIDAALSAHRGNSASSRARVAAGSFLSR